MPVIPAEQAGLCPARESRNPVINVVELFVDRDATPAHRKIIRSSVARLAAVPHPKHHAFIVRQRMCVPQNVRGPAERQINSRTFGVPDGGSVS